MRLPSVIQVPPNPDSAYGRVLNRFLADLLGSICQKVNALADGRFSAYDLVATAAPTTGDYAQGDFVANKNRTEVGLIGAKYVVMGWVNTTGGSPGTFKECRCLTGN